MVTRKEHDATVDELLSTMELMAEVAKKNVETHGVMQETISTLAKTVINLVQRVAALEEIVERHQEAMVNTIWNTMIDPPKH